MTNGIVIYEAKDNSELSSDEDKIVFRVYAEALWVDIENRYCAGGTVLNLSEAKKLADTIYEQILLGAIDDRPTWLEVDELENNE